MYHLPKQAGNVYGSFDAVFLLLKSPFCSADKQHGNIPLAKGHIAQLQRRSTW